MSQTKYHDTAILYKEFISWKIKRIEIMANQRKLTKSVSKPLQIFIASTADLSHNQRHRSEMVSDASDTEGKIYQIFSQNVL